MAELTDDFVQRIRAKAAADHEGLLEDWASIFPASVAEALVNAEAENKRLRGAIESALDDLQGGKHYDAEALLERALSGSPERGEQ